VRGVWPSLLFGLDKFLGREFFSDLHPDGTIKTMRLILILISLSGMNRKRLKIPRERGLFLALYKHVI